MICPRTNGNCLCANAASCVLAGSVGFYDGVLATSPPPPTLAEIERLVDALVDAAIYSDVPDAQEAKAALMAAIRAYGRE